MSIPSRYVELDNLIQNVAELYPWLEGEISSLVVKLLELKDDVQRFKCMCAFIKMLECLVG